MLHVLAAAGRVSRVDCDSGPGCLAGHVRMSRPDRAQGKPQACRLSSGSLKEHLVVHICMSKPALTHKHCDVIVDHYWYTWDMADGTKTTSIQVVQALQGLNATDAAQRGRHQLGAGRHLLHTGPRQLSCLTDTAACGTRPGMPFRIQMSTHKPPAFLKMSVTASASPMLGVPQQGRAGTALSAGLPGAAFCLALAHAAGSKWPSCNPASKFCPPKDERDGLGHPL